LNQELDISIVIVNYNVEYFLEQCLNSVFNALKNIKGEVFVVDNNSIDGSVDMVRAKFPNVQLIANKQNSGFSKANNQAINLSQGKYVLLLNPDTVVEEDTFEKIVTFMNQHDDAGGLGVRMIDGKGNFLPESKRGLPTPSVAFCKIFGLSKIFPKSKLFAKYHLGYLSEFETAEIEILSGAFMLIRKSVLDQVGSLDETFFMYGEDIDLSYRILLGGYKNYYFPETRIIHYKGESTKKSSINYVFVFYKAMVIFAQKHFSKNNAFLFSFLINLAIYFRAGLALFSRFIKKAALPVFDFGALLGGLFALTRYWQQINIEFPIEILKYSLPGYTFIWMTSNYYAGAYDYPTKLFRFLTGTLIGTFLILSTYALLPKSFQFSRLYILTGAIWVVTYFIFSRIYLHFSVKGKFRLNAKANTRFIIVGSDEEVNRVKNVMTQINAKIDQLLSVSPSNEKEENQVGILSQLDQLVLNHKTDEIIFCAKDISAHEIIYWMIQLGQTQLDFKIAQPDSLYLIGSNSIHSAGDLYIVDINEISTKRNLRNKRSLDLLISISFLIMSPILIFVYKKKLRFLFNMIACLLGKRTLVGYFLEEKSLSQQLPLIKKGILTPFDALKIQNSQMIGKLNLIYARDYNVFKDVMVLRQAWKKLDR